MHLKQPWTADMEVCYCGGKHKMELVQEKGTMHRVYVIWKSESSKNINNYVHTS